MLPSLSIPLPYTPIPEADLESLRSLARSDATTASETLMESDLSVINDARLGLQKCQKFIADLKAAINEAERHFKHFQDCINYYKSRTAPIRSLPPELLRYIFVLVDDNRIKICEGKVLMRHLSKIEKVCSLWHSIIRSTPQLEHDRPLR